MEDEPKIKSLEEVIEERKPKRLVVFVSQSGYGDEEIRSIAKQYGLQMDVLVRKMIPSPSGVELKDYRWLRISHEDFEGKLIQEIDYGLFDVCNGSEAKMLEYILDHDPSLIKKIEDKESLVVYSDCSCGDYRYQMESLRLLSYHSDGNVVFASSCDSFDKSEQLRDEHKAFVHRKGE